MAAGEGVPESLPVPEGELEADITMAEAERVVDALGVGRALGVAEGTHSGSAMARMLTSTPEPCTLELVLKVKVRVPEEEVPLTAMAVRLGLPEKV